MKISMIPDYILDDLASRNMTTEQIESSTPEALFDEYLMWNGFYGHAPTFIDVIDSLREAEETE